MGPVNIPSSLTRCSVCHRQIVLVQPYPSFDPPTSDIAVRSDDQNDRFCLAHIYSDPILQKAQRLSNALEVPNQVPPAKVTSTAPTARTIHRDSDPPRPFSSRAAINWTADTLFCSDQCRFADRRSCPGAIAVEYDSSSSTSPCLPLTPPNSLVNTDGSQDDSDCLTQASSESGSSTSSPATGRALNAYSHLCPVCNFDPLPPLPSFPPKMTTSPQGPAPLEGGIIMAARRIQAALCINTPPKTSWGYPIYSDSGGDNKPIPGWTDGSNAWRASVYGLAPPRDFTRTDPDEAAIRAYGSYVATPHRSRGLQSAHGNKPATEVQSPSSSSLPPSTLDPSTQELYRQYCESFTRRSRSRTSDHVRGARSTFMGPPREVPLLKPGAEGRLLVPDVKMRLVKSTFSGADLSAGKTNVVRLDGQKYTHRERKGDMEPNGNHAQSYASEAVTYPILRTAPKKEIRVERRVVDGVEQDVEVEVLIEQPIKRLFLFGGARD